MVLVYAPHSPTNKNQLLDIIGELELVGEECAVEICSRESIDDLAKEVYKYENISIN